MAYFKVHGSLETGDFRKCRFPGSLGALPGFFLNPKISTATDVRRREAGFWGIVSLVRYGHAAGERPWKIVLFVMNSLAKN